MGITLRISFVLPFSVKPALQINFSAIPANAWLAVIYVIIMNTFIAYFLINYALQRVMPSLVSYYTYLQPFVPAISSVSVGIGSITWTKLLAAVLIFSGVWMVNSNANKENKTELIIEGEGHSSE